MFNVQRDRKAQAETRLTRCLARDGCEQCECKIKQVVKFTFLAERANTPTPMINHVLQRDRFPHSSIFIALSLWRQSAV